MTMITTMMAAQRVYRDRHKAWAALEASGSPDAPKRRHALLRDTNTELRRLGLVPDPLKTYDGQLRWPEAAVSAALAARPGRGRRSAA
jgi:hypothetical protein